MLLAPTINLLRQPRWGRAQETYGEDTSTSGAWASRSSAARSDTSSRAPSTSRLNSIEDTRFDVDVRVDERTLREVYLPHFAGRQTATSASVMSAYNKVNGEYCAENHHLLTDILKGDWGFDGLRRVGLVPRPPQHAASALAGLDIEMPVAGVLRRARWSPRSTGGGRR